MAIERGEAQTDQRDAAEVPWLQMFAEQAPAQNERADRDEKAHAVGDQRGQGNLVRCVAPLDDLEVGKAEDVPPVPLMADPRVNWTVRRPRPQSRGRRRLRSGEPGLIQGRSGTGCADIFLYGWP